MQRHTDFVQDQLASAPTLWLPGLASHLIQSFTAARPPWTREVYGTRRWLERDPATGRDCIGYADLQGNQVAIELLPEDIRARFPGLRFVTAPPAGLAARIATACALFEPVHGLVDTMGSLARCLHPLTSPRGFDTSHSDPQLPFSIFVSIPDETEGDARSRLAESILHETMHLQLTLIEEAVPLVANEAEAGYSPWQRRERPLRGLLHGLYVFAVISQYLQATADVELGASAYRARRRRLIADEARLLAAQVVGLTPAGANLWERCRATALGG